MNLTEVLGAVGAFIGAVLGAVGLFIKTWRQVGESNAAILLRKVDALEANQRRQEVINQHLTSWQFDARELIRLQSNRLVDLGVEMTPQMVVLQRRLSQEIDYTALYDDDEIESAAPKKRRSP